MPITKENHINKQLLLLYQRIVVKRILNKDRFAINRYSFPHVIKLCKFDISIIKALLTHDGLNFC